MDSSSLAVLLAAVLAGALMASSMFLLLRPSRSARVTLGRHVADYVDARLAEFADGSAYAGPWVVGYQRCSLCGATAAAIAPVRSLSPVAVAGYECDSCGQPCSVWNYDCQQGPIPILDEVGYSGGDDDVPRAVRE
jgi:hypothetical protein